MPFLPCALCLPVADVANADIVLQQVGTTQAEVNTPSDSSARSNIALLYGNLLGKELLQVGPSVHKSLGIEKVEGWATNANWSQKRSTFLLFINRKFKHFGENNLRKSVEMLSAIFSDRLVDSGKMKKAIESLYTAYLPKGASPFVYIRYVHRCLAYNAFPPPT